jgi:hypothetical protein
MVRTEEQDPSVLRGDSDTVQSMISWQLSRFHHLQSLAQGLLSIIVAAIAIAVSAFSILNDDLPLISYNQSQINELATQFSVNEIVISLTFGLNLLLVAILLIGAFSTLVVYLSRVYFVLSLEPPIVNFSFRTTLINGDSENQTKSDINNGGILNQADITGIPVRGSTLFRPSINHEYISDYFTELVHDLNIIVKEAQYAIKAALLRLLLLFSSTILAIQIYSIIVSGELSQLLFMDIYFLFFPVLTAIIDRVPILSGTVFPDNPISDNGLIRNFEDNIDNSEFSKTEVLCYSSVAILCVLVVSMWFISLMPRYI